MIRLGARLSSLMEYATINVLTLVTRLEIRVLLVIYLVPHVRDLQLVSHALSPLPIL